VTGSVAGLGVVCCARLNGVKVRGAGVSHFTNSRGVILLISFLFLIKISLIPSCAYVLFFAPHSKEVPMGVRDFNLMSALLEPQLTYFIIAACPPRCCQISELLERHAHP
jgi:hypothetical protein